MLVSWTVKNDLGYCIADNDGDGDCDDGWEILSVVMGMQTVPKSAMAVSTLFLRCCLCAVGDE